jgi:putative iron-only hydrogenase system regulator
MERRLGGALILVENKESVNKLNQILTTHANVIIGRQGIPLLDRGVSIISLVLQGTTDEISALTGPIGKLDGVQVKSLMMKGNPL